MSAFSTPLSGSLRQKFAKAAGAAKKFATPAAIIGGVLLGGTALGTPLLGSTLLTVIGFLASCAFLGVNSSTVVSNAEEMGARQGVSPLLMGVGLGFATSLPELCVSVSSVFQGSPEMGIGNIAGSNIVNIGLILGVTALVSPLRRQQGLNWKFNTKAMAVSTAVFGAQLALGGALTPLLAPAMFAGLGYYLYRSHKLQEIDAAATPSMQESQAPVAGSNLHNLLWGAGGLAGLVFSSSFLVASATTLATTMGISPALVGALAVAVGTSLPELMVNLNSAWKGDTDMALGNILGSNIFNILMVGGLLALAGTPVSPDFSGRSLLGVLNLGGFLLSGTVLAGTLLKNEGALSRKAGAALLGAYTAFGVASARVAGPVPSPSNTATAVSAPAPQLASR